MANKKRTTGKAGRKQAFEQDANLVRLLRAVLVTRVERIEVRTPRSFRASKPPIQYLRVSTETGSI